MRLHEYAGATPVAVILNNKPRRMNTLSNAIHWANANPNLSGWAQAIGALLAIIATLVAVLIQHRLSVKEKRQNDAREQLVRLRTVTFLSHEIALTLGTASRFIKDLQDTHFADSVDAEEQLSDYENRLAAIPLHTLSSPAAITWMTVLLRNTTVARRLVERIRREGRGPLSSDLPALDLAGQRIIIANAWFENEYAQLAKAVRIDVSRANEADTLSMTTTMPESEDSADHPPVEVVQVLPSSEKTS
jgi:hypothetical protein